MRHNMAPERDWVFHSRWLPPWSSRRSPGRFQQAIAAPGSSGTVIGQRVEVSVGGNDPANDLVQELRDAASAVRQDKGHKSWVQGLLSRVGSLADRAVDAVTLDAVHQAAKAVFGS